MAGNVAGAAIVCSLLSLASAPLAGLVSCRCLQRGRSSSSRRPTCTVQPSLDLRLRWAPAHSWGGKHRGRLQTLRGRLRGSSNAQSMLGAQLPEATTFQSFSRLHRTIAMAVDRSLACAIDGFFPAALSLPDVIWRERSAALFRRSFCVNCSVCTALPVPWNQRVCYYICSVVRYPKHLADGRKSTLHTVSGRSAATAPWQTSTGDRRAAAHRPSSPALRHCSRVAQLCALEAPACPVDGSLSLLVI